MLYEAILFENKPLVWGCTGVRVSLLDVPAGVSRGVSSSAYSEYRSGLDSACADIVVVTRREDGEPAVLLSLRRPDKCFGNKWWIYGGAIHAYRTICDFLSERAAQECGVSAEPEALVGVYRTMAEDHIASTLNVCYAARVPVEAIQAKLATDSGHTSARLFSLNELVQIPLEQRHWYPMRVSQIVLASM